MNANDAKAKATEYAKRDRSMWHVFRVDADCYVLASQLDKEIFWPGATPVFTADPIFLKPTATPAAIKKKRLPQAARLHHLSRFYGGSTR